MPKLDKNTLSLTFKFDSDRFLRFRLASDEERAAVGFNEKVHTRPGIDLVKAAGRRWEIDKYDDLVATAGAPLVRHGRSVDEDELLRKRPYTTVSESSVETVAVTVDGSRSVREANDFRSVRESPTDASLAEERRSTFTGSSAADVSPAVQKTCNRTTKTILIIGAPSLNLKRKRFMIASTTGYRERGCANNCWSPADSNRITAGRLDPEQPFSPGGI